LIYNSKSRKLIKARDIDIVEAIDNQIPFTVPYTALATPSVDFFVCF